MLSSSDPSIASKIRNLESIKRTGLYQVTKSRRINRTETARYNETESKERKTLQENEQEKEEEGSGAAVVREGRAGFHTTVCISLSLALSRSLSLQVTVSSSKSNPLTSQNPISPLASCTLQLQAFVFVLFCRALLLPGVSGNFLGNRIRDEKLLDFCSSTRKKGRHVGSRLRRGDAAVSTQQTSLNRKPVLLSPVRFD